MKLGMDNLVLRMVITVIAAAAMAALAGVIIGVPVLRLSGDYLAIVTLAFGEIIRNVLNCVYVSLEDNGAIHFGFLNTKLPGSMLVNGPNGVDLSGFKGVKLSNVNGFITGFVLIIIALIIIQNLVHSRSGRAIMAVRDNRIAAETTGINTMKYRMMAFVISAAIGGMAGALYGLSSTTFLPSAFKFDYSINVLVFVVLGGIGNMTGSMISATVLTILPVLLLELENYRMLIYAVVLILVTIATNNAAIRSMLQRVIDAVRGKQKAAEEAKHKGGAQ